MGVHPASTHGGRYALARLFSHYTSLCAAAFIAVVACSGETSRPRPNLVLITADTMRSDDLEIYGGAARTPAMKRLRDEGILFQEAYSVAFGTTPSHASLLTSLAARDHGVYDNWTLLREPLVTLAEVLKEGGYSTGAFVSAPPVGSKLGFSQGFDRFEGAEHQRPGDVTATLALEWMGQTPKPFFLWVHFYDPHQPYNPPPEYLDSGREEPHEERPTPPVTMEADFTRLVLVDPFLDAGSAEFDQVHREARRRYLAEIEFMDAQIGRILDRLDAQSQYDSSLVALVSDHGENFREPYPRLAFTHRGLHSGVARLAAVMKLPRSQWAGTTRTCLIGNLDFAPTWLGVLGLGTPAGWSGRDAAGCLEESKDVGRDYLILEGSQQSEWSVRTRDWVYREPLRRGSKLEPADLGYVPGEEWKLHDVSTDPGEAVNLADSPSAEVTRKQQIFHKLLADFGSTSSAEAETLDDPEYLETLRALGYLN